MSADNGIYILRSKKGDTLEYRVAHLRAVEDAFDEQLGRYYMASMFGNCTVLYDRDNAWKIAREKADEHEVLEYGVSELKWDGEFPNLTAKEGLEALERHWAQLKRERESAI